MHGTMNIKIRLTV